MPQKRRIDFKRVSRKAFESFRRRSATTVAGKRVPLKNIVPVMETLDTSLAVKRKGTSRRYQARYAGTMDWFRHERSHARQAVFHHEIGFPLNPHSYLADFEERAFFENSTAKEFNDQKKVIAQQREKFGPHSQAEFNDILAELNQKPGPESDRAFLNTTWIKAAIVNEFPTHRAALHALVKLYKDPRMRSTLKQLNSISIDRLPSNSTIDSHGHLLAAKVLRNQKHIVEYLQKEAQNSQTTRKTVTTLSSKY